MKDCAYNARHAVHGGVVVLVLCTRHWRDAVARLVDAAGLRVHPIRAAWGAA